MSHTEENVEFEWLKKGRTNPDRQYFESFLFDGVEYDLYDSVYLYHKDEPEPYIGKLIKIWEDRKSKEKKVDVLWFFRPVEISNYISEQGVIALKNELFLGSGDGRGLTSTNLLEAIAGKCNVVCTSKAANNPKPSALKIRRADYIFYRTFNVSTMKISAKIDKKIAEIEDTFIYNRAEAPKRKRKEAVGKQGTIIRKEVQMKPGSSLPLNRGEPGDGNIVDISTNYGAVQANENLKPAVNGCRESDMPCKKVRVSSSDDVVPEDNTKIVVDENGLKVYTRRRGVKNHDRIV